MTFSCSKSGEETDLGLLTLLCPAVQLQLRPRTQFYNIIGCDLPGREDSISSIAPSMTWPAGGLLSIPRAGQHDEPGAAVGRADLSDQETGIRQWAGER